MSNGTVHQDYSQLSLEDVFDGHTFETIEESPVAYVTRARYRNASHAHAPYYAIKTGSVSPEFSREPHDIRKELKLLSSCSHANIIEILGNTYDDATESIHFWMPFLQWSLQDVLDNPRFTLGTCPDSVLQGVCPQDEKTSLVLLLMRSFALQIISTLAYLHAPERRIAHRDVKPRNFLITAGGCIKLIDFGIAWNESLSSAPDALWPEPLGSMCSHVCTGPYRAPETIFGPVRYDPFAVDLWSLGCVLAEYFTGFTYEAEDEDEDETIESPLDEADDAPIPPYRNIDHYEKRMRGQWYRNSLFDASRGAIGLAWSIFKIRGTPTAESWPSFSQLPDANKVTFEQTPPLNLRSRLPNLWDGADSSRSCAPDEPEKHNLTFPLDLVERLLVYPPEQRVKAEDALRHPFFTRSPSPVLVPSDYAELSSPQCRHELNGRSLADLWFIYNRTLHRR